MTVKHAKWHLREPIIREHAGKIETRELAKMLGMTPGRLRQICANNGISLMVPGLRAERMAANHPRHRGMKHRPAQIDANALWRPTTFFAGQEVSQ
jgi:hypothetical protein